MLPTVKLDIDIVRYNEALGKEEKGTNEKREDDLLKRFPPTAEITLDKPAVVIDNGGRYILWYLPEVISQLFQVCYDHNDGHRPYILTIFKADMFSATAGMRNELKHSIATSRPGKKHPNWRIDDDHFFPTIHPSLTPGCINVSPCWFKLGREVSRLL
jgi:hypothetical protein